MTTIAAPATTAAASSSDRLDRSSGKATNAASSERQEREASVSEDRETGRPSQRKREPDALPFRDDDREESYDRDDQAVEHLPVQVHVVPDEERVQRGDRRADDAHRQGTNTPPDLEHDDRGQSGDRDMRDADDEPVPLEDLVEPREEPRVQGLRVAGWPARQKPERPTRDQGLREAVALLDELLEDLAPLGEQDDDPRDDGCDEHDRDRAAACHRELLRDGSRRDRSSSHARCQSSSTSRHHSRWP